VNFSFQSVRVDWSQPYTISVACNQDPLGDHVPFTLRAGIGDKFGASAQACISSWGSWLQASEIWTSGINTKTLGECLSAVLSTQSVGVVRMPTECDGIPRIRLDFSNSASWTSSTAIRVTVVPDSGDDKRLFSTEFTEPVPSCALEKDDCAAAWRNELATRLTPGQRKPVVPYWFPQAKPGRNVFGCPVPEELCKQAMNAYGKVVAPGRHKAVLYGSGPDMQCAIHVNRIALVYWPPKLASKDLCGKGGRAEYIASTGQPREGRSVLTVDELTIDSPPVFEVPYPTYARISRSCEWRYIQPSNPIHQS
jgi:hypothetical protein